MVICREHSDTAMIYDVSVDELSAVTESLKSELCPLGFELYPFKIGWYNEYVQHAFKLDYDFNCVAYVCLSVPSMFEKLFVPYLCQNKSSSQDLLDQCMTDLFKRVKQKFSEKNVRVIHDFEVHPSRRPLVLMQTAGHVSGSAYYYQRCDLEDDPWDENERIVGVCVHPKYGGWFAFRAVLIFPSVSCSALPRKFPACILSKEEIVRLLEEFNFSWRKGRYREVGKVQERYSIIQLCYFLLKPSQRQWLVEAIRHGNEPTAA